MAKKEKQLAIGIDLGTTNSCVATMQHGKPEVIVNTGGGRTTPSIVSFTPNDILFGEPAANNARNDPKNTVYDAKRLMGMRFSEPVVQEDIKHWPFKVVLGPADKPQIEVAYKGAVKKYFPEEIGAMLLKYLKETAEAHFGAPVNNAVITVPAYFKNDQKELTKAAGEMAGLNVLRIINEPTAAAIAYGLDHVEGEKNVLVFDFGGGTFDVSILTIDNGLFEVKATGGDTHLGGSDLDHKLAEYYAKEFARQHGISDEELKGRPLSRLKAQIENAKKNLSSATSTTVMIDSFYKGEDFTCTITRTKFEMICKEFFDKLLPVVEKVLIDSKFSKEQIDELVLVGGSTRIPKVQKMLSEYFNGKDVNKKVNPDEAVAHGAAIQAANLNGDLDESRQLLLIDVLPLSIGIETAGGVFTPIIPRNTQIPTTKEQVFTTYSDYQTEVAISIYEGERALVRDNRQLGVFKLTGIPSEKKNVPQINVKCSICANGILSVSADTSGLSNSVQINRETRSTSEEQVRRMQEEAERNKEQDEINRRKMEAFNELDGAIYVARDKLSGCKAEMRASVEARISEVERWKMSEVDPLNRSIEEYEAKKKEVEEIAMQMLSQGAQAQRTESSEPRVEEVN
jgi:heat shock 70kDa protein 1/2/6/8